MPDDPTPNDAPTPPQGVPVQPPAALTPWPDPPNYPPPQPNKPPGPWPQPEGHRPSWGQPPGYLDTPAPPTPVVSRADVEKPPADFDG